MKALDALGLGSSHWNNKALLKALPNECAIGFFDDTSGLFGNPIKNIRALLATGKVKVVRVQITYTKTHTLVSMDMLKNRVPLYEALAKDFPGVKFYISHTTEHMEKNKAKLLERMNLIKVLAPSCTPVNNPQPGAGITLEGYVNETHGTAPLKGEYFASLDGSDPASGIDALGWVRGHAKAKIVFGWGALCNLNDGNQPANPADRTAAPDEKYLSWMFDISEAPPTAPKPAFKAVPVVKPLLWKPNSQDTNDSREGMPCFIGKSDKTTLDIVTKDNKSIGKMVRPNGDLGTYLGGMFRHYSGWKGAINLWGYEIARKAFKVSGCTAIWLTDGKTYWGPIQPTYRRGFFR